MLLREANKNNASLMFSFNFLGNYMGSGSKKILVFVIGLLVLLVIFEVALRILGAFNVSQASTSDIEDGADYTILVPGDSFARGIAAPEGKDFPTQLGEMLNAAGDKKYRVVNTGVAGRNSTQILEALEEDISATNPDLVILLLGGANSWNSWGYGKSMDRRIGTGFFSSLRIVRLAGLIVNNISDKMSEGDIEHLEEEKFQEAMAKFNKAIQKDPKNGMAYFEMGKFYMYERNIEKAKEWFQNGTEVDPDCLENYIGMAGAFREVAQISKAREWYLRGSENVSEEDAPRIYSILANEFLREREFQKGWRWVLKGLESCPDCKNFYDFLTFVRKYSVAYRQQADSILQQAPPAKSLRTLDIEDITFNVPPTDEKPMKKDKELIRNWIEADLENAIEICRERGIKIIIQNYPLRGKNWNHFSRAYKLANGVLEDKALEYSLPFVDNKRAFDAMGERKEELFEPKGSAEHCNGKGYGLMAKNLYDVIIKMDLDSERQQSTKQDKKKSAIAEEFNHKGSEEAKAGRFREAIKHFTKAIDTAPDLVDGYINRGHAYMDLGQYEKALEDYDKAVEVEPLMPDAYNNRGYLKIITGDYEGAIDEYDKMLEVSPDHPFALNNRGLARFKKGDPEKALEDINKSISLDSTNSYAYRNRALIMIDRKNTAKACEDLRKAKELGFSQMYGPEVDQLINRHCR